MQEINGAFMVCFFSWITIHFLMDYAAKTCYAYDMEKDRPFRRRSAAKYLRKYIIACVMIITLTVFMIVLEPHKRYFTIFMLGVALGIISSNLSLQAKCDEYYENELKKEKPKDGEEERRMNKTALKDTIPMIVFVGGWVLAMVLAIIFALLA